MSRRRRRNMNRYRVILGCASIIAGIVLLILHFDLIHLIALILVATGFSLLWPFLKLPGN